MLPPSDAATLEGGGVINQGAPPVVCTESALILMFDGLVPPASARQPMASASKDFVSRLAPVAVAENDLISVFAPVPVVPVPLYKLSATVNVLPSPESESL